MLGLTLVAATAMSITPALAIEYIVADAPSGSFGKSTSIEPVTVVG